MNDLRNDPTNYAPQKIKDMPSAKELWDQAREQLGYTRENGYENSLLRNPQPYADRELEGDGPYTMEFQHELRCDALTDTLHEMVEQLADMTLIPRKPEIIEFPEQRREEQWEEMTLVSSNSKVVVRWQGDAREAGDIAQDALEAAQRDKEIERQEFGPTGPLLNPNTQGDQMDDASLKAGYYALAERIEKLESFIQELITKPSMSREMRTQGLELVEQGYRLQNPTANVLNPCPNVREAVERICPPRSQELGLELSIER